MALARFGNFGPIRLAGYHHTHSFPTFGYTSASYADNHTPTDNGRNLCG